MQRYILPSSVVCAATNGCGYSSTFMPGAEGRLRSETTMRENVSSPETAGTLPSIP